MWPAVVLVGSLVSMVTFSIWWLRRGDDQDDDGGWGWHGGHEDTPPDPPPPYDEPAWWPEFERDFDAYVTALR
jgi:hypothetical protein